MRPLAATVARIAARQYGRITHPQLIAAGVDADRIKRWVLDGRLRREHQGVFTLGHTGQTPRGIYLAAALAAGSGAVVSHRADAYLMGIWPWRMPAPEVTVPTVAHRRRPGIVIHRVRTIDPLDVTIQDGIPITIVPRILLDLAPTITPEQLTRICHEAWVRHRTRPEQIEACIERNPQKPGARKLRRALGSDVTLSMLEDAFIALLKTHDLALPRTNIDRDGDKVDCHWPQLDLTIELVTYRYHATRHAFETDVARRRRSNHLAYTYGDVTERGAATIADLRRLLT
ncbi:hypothetical protein BH20ACT16_BH20ACT16_11420 [soil metagenome]